MVKRKQKELAEQLDTAEKELDKTRAGGVALGMSEKCRKLIR